MEIFVKEDKFAPMRISCESEIVSVTRAPTRGIRQKNTRQPRAKFVHDSLKIHHPTRTGRTFHLQPIAIEMVVPLQCLDQQIVDGEPNRSAPIRVAAEEVGAGFAGMVVDAMLCAIRYKDARIFLVELR